MLINIPAKIESNNTVPAGIYKGIITPGELRRNDNTGNFATSLQVKLQSQGPDGSVNTIGRIVFDQLTWTDAALGMNNSKVKAICGREITELVEPGDISVEVLHMAVANAVTNREVMVQVTLDPVKRDGVIVEGEFRNNVKKYTACQS